MDLQNRRYRAEVKEVHSGDDLVMMVDLGIDGLHKKVRVRLYGVDAPSAYRASPDTEAGQIRDKVFEILRGSTCEIEVINTGKGGWLAKLFLLRNGQERVDFNQTMIDQGFVYKREDK